ncbi:hypothetical protein BGCPKDLD_3299 [Methylorubrum suomiense]|uniref:DSP-PTPase phosphatase fused to NAD+ Kinase domain-containing protein n=1 Tax=Methylorubrum suomiense TaxID=144191 RepID=A0ABQ4UX24_9HYPH|nr:hypothetical protein BGCPKDLD_3299 [Methylorubrum suomiense]
MMPAKAALRQRRKGSGSGARCRSNHRLLEERSLRPFRRPVFNRLFSPETRLARRRARLAKFEQPIAGPVARAQAWANMLLVDHGVFRLAYLNRHRIGTGLVWRSAQPSPHQLAWFKRQGVRTVVSLRGGREHGSWPLQREACERQGLRLVEFVLRSREAPSRETLLAAKDFFGGIEYPAVMHCKSGADRAGLAATLFLILHEGRPVREALRQLSPRYGHFRFAKTGILDAFFATYLREGEPRGQSFTEWVETSYDPEALKRDFRAGFWSDLAVDRLLRRE